MKLVQSRTPAPALAAVFDVIVDQQSVVQQLDRDRGGQRLIDSGSEQTRSGDAQAWTHHPSAAFRIVSQQIIEVTARLSFRKVFAQCVAGHRSILSEYRGDQAGVGAV